MGSSKAQSGGVGADAMRQLKMAVDYGKARMHKEARLSAQGALRHLCVANQIRARLRYGAEVRQLHRAIAGTLVIFEGYGEIPVCLDL